MSTRTLSELEIANILGEYGQAKPLVREVCLPSKEELELARLGHLTLTRLADLGMYGVSNPATVDEWRAGLRVDENGKPVGVSLGMGRSSELGLANVRYVPRP